MSLLQRIRDQISHLPAADFSAGEREDHWYGLRLSAILQVALVNSETDAEFEKCFLRIVGAFDHLKRERARTWLYNFLSLYRRAGDFDPKPRALAQRFLQNAPQRYRLNPDFFQQYLAEYAVTPKDNQARLVRLRDTYALQIYWSDPLTGLEDAGRYSLQEPDRIQFAFFVPTLASQLSLYPAELVACAGLSRIILCDSLRHDEKPMRGLAVYNHNAIFLNMAGGYLKESSCTLIHHEFFHLVDRFALKTADEDVEWTRLNPATFQYGRLHQSSADALAVTNDFPGFMTAYATTNSREDKAELFGHLVVNYAAVEKRIAEDKTFAAKVELMKSRLEGVCSALNPDYWEARREADFWTSCKPQSAAR